jgi:cytochrome c-type biogenesis protein CcmE
MKNRRIKVVVTVLVAVLGIGYVAAQSLGEQVAYYKEVAEITANPEPSLAKSTMQVHGYVVSGSIETKVVDQQTHRTFRLENKVRHGGEEIIVRHSGTAPDTFKDMAEVVATGKLVRENGKLYLDAVDSDRGISAKCPSKYSGDAPNKVTTNSPKSY